MWGRSAQPHARAAVQRRQKPEQACCCLLVALGPPQGLFDETVLELLDGAVEVESLVGERRPRDLLLRDQRTDAGGQMRRVDEAVFRQDDQPLEQVLELADVARPVVLPEVDHRFFGSDGQP